MALLTLLLTTACSGGQTPGGSYSFEFEPTAFGEGISLIRNPYRGFLYMCGIMPSESTTADNQSAKILKNLEGFNESIVLLEVNLSKYSNEAISDKAISQIDSVLGTIKDEGHTAIVRFVYDWDNSARTTEPNSIEQIASHMEQVGPVVNKYKDIVFALQGTFTGNCGEMNSSKYETVEDYRYLISKLADAADPSIFLSVRTPWQLRGINDSLTPLTEEAAHTGTVEARLGLFNDGMRGSETDLGTYGDQPLKGASDPTIPGTREDELSFQEELCRYVPNGGEAIYGEDTSYIEPDRAIADMRRMQITYLNKDHDINVINRWKKDVYRGGGVFDGASVYDYISSHLGYRYYVKEADIRVSEEDPGLMTVSFTVENSGFAPCYRALEARLNFIPIAGDGTTSDGQAAAIPLNLDTRKIGGSSDARLAFNIPISDVIKGRGGETMVTLSFSDPATGSSIYFANDYRNLHEDDSVILGTLTARD